MSVPSNTRQAPLITPKKASSLRAEEFEKTSWWSGMMGLFSGGKKTQPSNPDTAGEGDSSTGLARELATVPVGSARDKAAVNRAASAPTAAKTPANRRSARVAQRELMFALVRESMVRAGVLSGGYQFKVLSLDPHGAQFLVMMDLAAEFGGQTERLSEIEALIAQSAKHRHNILVQAVYWRFSDHVVLGKPARSGVVAPTPTATAAAAVEPPAPTGSAQMPVRPNASRFEPLAEDELAAFQQALRSGIAPVAAATHSTGKQAGAKGAGLLITGYEDTEVVDENEGMPVLSPTQYGDLPLN